MRRVIVALALLFSAPALADVDTVARGLAIRAKDASNLTAGTLDAARLPSVATRNDTASTFSAQKIFSVVPRLPLTGYVKANGVGADPTASTEVPATDISFLVAGINAVARNLDQEAKQRLNVEQFASFQDAINYASLTNRSVFVPCGTYTFSAHLSILTSVDIVGENDYCVKIQTSSLTDDVLQIGDNVTTVRYVHLRNITFWSTVTKTAGAAINARKTTDIELEHVNAGTQDLQAVDGNRLYNGVVFNQFATESVRVSRIVGASNDCLQIYGNAAQTHGAEFVMDSSNFVSNCGHDGIVVGGGAGGVHLEPDVQYAGRYGLYISKTLTAATNREVMLGPFFAADNNATAGIYIDASSLQYFQCNGCWSAGSSAGPGLHVASPNTGNYDISNPYWVANKSHGAYFASGFGGHIVWNGGTVAANGNVTAAHGIWVEDPTATSSIQIKGVRSSTNGVGGVGSGIVISGAGALTTTPIVLIGNDVSANAGIGISNTAPCNSYVVMWGNSGINTNCISTITGGLWNGTTIGVAYGGTGGSAASGTLLDNITGFSGTGFLKRTGAGAYSFIADLPRKTTIAGLTACGASTLGGIEEVSDGTAYGTGAYGSAVGATGAVHRLVICTNTAGPTTYAWAYN